MNGLMSLGLIVAVGASLLAGFPVAFTLAGVALIFALIGVATGMFDPAFLGAFPSRIFGIMSNETLIAVPVFVFIMLVGTLMAASTGIVGATVVTMGLLSLPTMLKNGYKTSIASGSICAAGTLGQIIPPSIVLILLADVLSNAYQQAQLQLDLFSPETISVGELFAGALLPGLILVGLYMLYLVLAAYFKPSVMPAVEQFPGDEVSLPALLNLLAGPLILIVAVLGSILMGLATPTEAAAVGATGAMLLALKQRHLSRETLRAVVYQSARVSAMVFMILIGASLFSLVFRGYGGDEYVQSLLNNLPGGEAGALIIVMLALFLLGFILDFIEITYVVIPIVGTVLLAMGIDPVWLGIMIAINLQTSFLTPPFGFSLFYLRGVAPPEVATPAIYKGVIPFIVIQLLMLGLLTMWPELATWLPDTIYSG
jgi:tripartite ATP-independent transporter DctM subunit